MGLEVIGKTLLNLGRKCSSTAVKAASKPTANAIHAPQLTQLAADTFTSTIKQAKKLSLEEKIQLLIKKYPNLVPEDIGNKNLIDNIDIALALPSDRFVLKGLKSHSYKGVLPEAILELPQDPSLISRFLQRGFPVYVADESYKLQQTIKHIPEFAPKLNLGKDVQAGEDIVRFYQRNLKTAASVNKALRLGEDLTPEAKKCVQFFDTHQRQLGQNKVLIRGADDYGFANLKVGETFVDKGFVSTMERSGLNNIEDFVYGKHFIVIKAPAASKVIVPADWTGKHTMSEIILPRNTKFRIISNTPLTDYGCRGSEAISDRRLITVEIVEK